MSYDNYAETQKSAASMPRLAYINSFAGFGRCSTTIALPVISAMQVQVCPIPTSILSNHLAFPLVQHYDYTPHMPEYIQVWEQLGLSFDGLYCGFLGNAEQIHAVEAFLAHFKPAVFLLDPVMGDRGKLYSSITPSHCEAIRALLSRATLITPNITEACLLTDTPYTGENLTQSELDALCGKLSRFCSGQIVLTGITTDTTVSNYVWEQGQGTLITLPLAGTPRHGTGDLLASVLAANALQGKNLADSVRQAADFIVTCIRGSDKMQLPPLEGIAFEKYLYQLIPQNPD